MVNGCTAALLRAVLEEVCENVSRDETGVRAHVASKLLEAASGGEMMPDYSRRAVATGLSARRDWAPACRT